MMYIPLHTWAGNKKYEDQIKFYGEKLMVEERRVLQELSSN